MGNLVDSLVRLFEFITQGILALFVLIYALVWFHPLKDALTHNIEMIAKYMVRTHWKKPIPEPAIAAILVGGIYFLGVLTNVVGYWALEPVHHRVIEVVDESTAMNPGESFRSVEVPYWSTTLLPLGIGQTKREKNQGTYSYQKYLNEEVL